MVVFWPSVEQSPFSKLVFLAQKQNRNDSLNFGTVSFLRFIIKKKKRGQARSRRGVVWDISWGGGERDWGGRRGLLRAAACQKNMATNGSCYTGMKTMGSCLNGVCDPVTGSCICNAFYSGHADFVTMVRANGTGFPVVLDCPTNTVAIRFMYALVLVVYLMGSGKMIKTMNIQWPIYKRNPKFSCCCQHTPLFLYTFGNLAVLLVIALTLIKIIDPDQTIGATPAPTILFTIVRLTFFAMAFVIQVSSRWSGRFLWGRPRCSEHPSVLAARYLPLLPAFPRSTPPLFPHI